MAMNFLVSVKLRFIFIIIHKVELLYITKTFLIIEERHLAVCHWRNGTVSEVRGNLLIAMQNDLLLLTIIFLLGLKKYPFMGQFDFVQFFLLRNLIGDLVEEFGHLLHIYTFTNNDEIFVGCLVYQRERDEPHHKTGCPGFFFAIWITVFARIFN